MRVVLEDGTVMLKEGSNAWPDGYARLEDGLVELFGSPGGSEQRVVPGKEGVLPDSYIRGQDPSCEPELDDNGDVIPG